MIETIESRPYICKDDFGYTNDKTQFEAVALWIADAVADGWSMRPTYSSEPVERAITLDRDGYRIMAINRSESNGKKPGNWYSESKINIWGPDGLTIPPPQFYDFAKIAKFVTHCSVCKTDGVKTVRYSFAGRCCEKCLPEMRAKHERPGWCD